MTPEELDEARVKEAYREWVDERGAKGHGGLKVAAIAARLAREGWTPHEPVDPDILAFREFASKEAKSASLAEAYLDGDMDSGASARLFLAGARMAREQERERARPLVECCVNIQQFSGWADGQRAAQALAKYRGEA